MTRTSKKIVLWSFAGLIGLPVALVVILLAWGYFADRTNGTIVSSGITRHYLLYVPKTYDPSRPTPLIISFHPAATWPAVQMKISRWNDMAEQHGFIVVYPAGSGAFFDGFTPGQHIWPGGPRTLPRDAKFISELIDKLGTEYNIDPNRIYADGISNGGSMAFLLSCELPGRIAAIGAVAAAHEMPWHCHSNRPVPTIAFHGTADKFAPYLGGSSPVAPTLANIPEWAAHVAQRNQCKGVPVEDRPSASVKRLTYKGCAEKADVVLYTVEGGGHTWPGNTWLAEWIVGRSTSEINATHIMWDFFLQHPLSAR